MKGLRMFLECACGGQVSPAILYCGEDYKLYIEGICQACTKHRTISIDYKKLWKISDNFRTGQPLRPPFGLAPPTFSKEDISLLAEMKIIEGV